MASRVAVGSDKGKVAETVYFSVVKRVDVREPELVGGRDGEKVGR
jgi:hypothetical protein